MDKETLKKLNIESRSPAGTVNGDIIRKVESQRNELLMISIKIQSLYDYITKFASEHNICLDVFAMLDSIEIEDSVERITGKDWGDIKKVIKEISRESP